MLASSLKPREDDPGNSNWTPRTFLYKKHVWSRLPVDICGSPIGPDYEVGSLHQFTSPLITSPLVSEAQSSREVNCCDRTSVDGFSCAAHRWCCWDPTLSKPLFLGGCFWMEERDYRILQSNPEGFSLFLPLWCKGREIWLRLRLEWCPTMPPVCGSCGIDSEWSTPNNRETQKSDPFGAHLDPGCSILCAYLRNITEIRRVTAISPPYETYSHRETVAKSVGLMGKPLGSPCSPSTWPVSHVRRRKRCALPPQQSSPQDAVRSCGGALKCWIPWTSRTSHHPMAPKSWDPMTWPRQMPLTATATGPAA